MLQLKMGSKVVCFWLLLLSARYLHGTGMKLALVNGKKRCQGRVKLVYRDTEGSICDNSWGLEDAQVVCRQLGCGYALAAPGNAHFGRGEGSILLDKVECRGDESFLWQCSHRGWFVHNCGHGRDAGVICSAAHSIQSLPRLPEENYTCGGLLTNLSGAICSPYYPENYPNDAECIWEIQVESNYRIQLTFTEIRLEVRIGPCNYDILTVYTDLPQNLYTWKEICYGTGVTFFSSANRMRIHFESDAVFTNKGFYAVYEAIPQSAR